MMAERTSPEEQDTAGPGCRVAVAVELDQRAVAVVAAVSTRGREPVTIDEFRRSLEQDGAAELVLDALVAVAMAPTRII